MKQFVDLHLHSFQSRRNHDVIQWTDELSTLIKLRDNGIKVYAITDHDTFSSSLYKKNKQTIESHKFDITIFPGVEITMKRKNESKGHVLFIFDNSISDAQAKQLEQVVFRNAHSYGTNLNTFIENVNKLGIDYMMIPHVGKCDHVIFEDMESCIDMVYYVESPNNKPELLKFNSYIDEPKKNIMFSDTHNWDNYKGSKVFLDSDEISLNSLKQNLKMEGEVNGQGQDN